MRPEPSVSVQELCKTLRVFKNPAQRLGHALFGGPPPACKEFHALSGVSFTVYPGQTLGVIGRNGSGKSTLLRCLAGISQPSGGRVRVRGRLATLLELGAGFNPEFTGRENVHLAASVLGLTPAQTREKFEAIEKFAGLGRFMDEALRTYSSGMYARLAFAVAAHADADVLLVDEVLAVGDAAFTQRCMRFLRRFKRRGALVFVSHDTSAVLALCDQALWLDQGRVRALGPARQVCFAYLAEMSGSCPDMTLPTKSAPPHAPDKAPAQDVRREDFARAGYRNALEVFDFSPEGPWFGTRGATIEDVRLVAASSAGQDTPAAPGAPLRPDAPPSTATSSQPDSPTLAGGETVSLEVRCRALTDQDRPIVGFYVKDRLGQHLFGDNTFLTHRHTPCPVRAGEPFVASFSFQMPYLPSGDYAVCAAVANGTQEEHVQLHWLDEALFFRVESSHVVRGLVGIPMLAVALSGVGGK